MSSFLEIAVSVAREAGALQMDHLGGFLQVEYKGEKNLVTKVDKACEKLITDRIQGAFPEHDFLGEEGGGIRKHSDYKWIVDPLDGTTNYAHGYPLFCVSIALEHKGEIILGVVFEPNRNELFFAEKGKGSFVGEKRLKVSPHATLKESLLATGFAYNINSTNDNNLDHFSSIIRAAQAVRRDGVAAVDLCYVAAGRYDGFWELNLFPWDVAAGLLILREAGGTVTDFAGEPFSPYDKKILATNGSIHQAMLNLLQKR